MAVINTDKNKYMQTYFLMAIALLAGAVLPLQAGLNARMGHVLQSPVMASFISFVTGALGLLIYMLINKIPLSQLSQARFAPAYLWVAGLLGAFYVTSVILLAPKMGVALTFSLVIGGQMLVSLLFDHFGLMGLPANPVSYTRILGVVLLIAGVFLIRK
jgi:bacterial/archaeal transporter family-2 protein